MSVQTQFPAYHSHRIINNTEHSRYGKFGVIRGPVFLFNPVRLEIECNGQHSIRIRRFHRGHYRSSWSYGRRCPLALSYHHYLDKYIVTCGYDSGGRKVDLCTVLSNNFRQICREIVDSVCYIRVDEGSFVLAINNKMVLVP